MDSAIMFDRPIPGQSLTKPPGGSKMERPPQFPKPEDAAEYIWDKLTKPKRVVQMEILLRNDLPVTYLTRNILFACISEGTITVDVAVLLANTVYNMIISIAELKGIPYVEDEPDPTYESFLDDNIDLLDKMKKPKQEEKAAEAPMQEANIFSGLNING